MFSCVSYTLVWVDLLLGILIVVCICSRFGTTLLLVCVFLGLFTLTLFLLLIVLFVAGCCGLFKLLGFVNLLLVIVCFWVCYVLAVLCVYWFIYVWVVYWFGLVGFGFLFLCFFSLGLFCFSLWLMICVWGEW